MAPPESAPIRPGFLAKGQTTLVWVTPGVDYKWYVNSIAVLVTAGAKIPPYGPATPCQFAQFCRLLGLT